MFKQRITGRSVFIFCHSRNHYVAGSPNARPGSFHGQASIERQMFSTLPTPIATPSSLNAARTGQLGNKGLLYLIFWGQRHGEFKKVQERSAKQ